MESWNNVFAMEEKYCVFGMVKVDNIINKSMMDIMVKLVVIV